MPLSVVSDDFPWRKCCPMGLPYSTARFKQTVRRFAEPIWNRFRFGYFQSNAHDEEGLRRRLNDSSVAPPVFVYQMGKVASTSIYQSLLSAYPGEVFHAHGFDRFHTSARIRILFEYWNRSQASPVKLISLVREPVSRNISAFFQNFKRDTGIEIDRCRLSSGELKQRFLSNYPHEIPWVWFDRNIKQHFYIDVYAQPFPNSGHVQIRRGDAELLLMRHDLPQAQKQSLIGNYLELDHFRLLDHNVGAEKRYANLYAQFKKEKLPRWYLNRLASTQYMHHFFESDIGDIFETWCEEPLTSSPQELP